MKRYMFFSGPAYYASGGIADLYGFFIWISFLKLNRIKTGNPEWLNIFDTLTGGTLSVEGIDAAGAAGNVCFNPEVEIKL